MRTKKRFLSILLTLALVMTVMLPSEVAMAAQVVSKIEIQEVTPGSTNGSFIVPVTVRDINDNPINKGKVRVYLNDEGQSDEFEVDNGGMYYYTFRLKCRQL